MKRREPKIRRHAPAALGRFPSSDDARYNIIANPFDWRYTKADLNPASHASPATNRSTPAASPEELTPTTTSQR
jgi:hypothetical protein